VETPKHFVQAVTDKYPSGLKTASEIEDALKSGISEARVIELANSGYMPHYRIDGGEPLFMVSEVKSWVSANLMQHNQGREMPTSLRVCVAAPPVTDAPPKCIENLPGLQQIPHVEYQSGVYFLCKDQEVIYIGQSVSPGSRISAHCAEGRRAFDSAFLLPCPRSELNELEGSFIRVLKPSLQGRAGPNGKPIAPMTKGIPEEVVSKVVSGQYFRPADNQESDGISDINA